jgi:hypothetical protein
VKLARVAAPTVPPFTAPVVLVVVVAEDVDNVPIPPVKAVEAPPARLTPPATIFNSSSVSSMSWGIWDFSLQIVVKTNFRL